MGMDASRTRLLKLYEFLKTVSLTTGHTKISEIRTQLNVLMGFGEYDRRTIYRDLYLLNQITDLNTVFDRKHKCYRVVQKEHLNSAELSIVVNAILSARFDTACETKKFAERLYKLAGHEKMGAHKIENRVKHGEGKETLQKIDMVNHAIEQSKKICFDYKKFDASGKYETVYRNCLVSPYKMLWQYDRMYLVGHYTGEIFSHYRIERICNITESNENRKPVSDIIGYGRVFNEAEYLRQSVGLSQGESAEVEIIFKQSALCEVFDTLGRNISVKDNNDGTFTLRDKVIINKKLKRWILGFGADAEVIRPESLRDEVASK
jgi:predicted DNA-binding transcriptional regulator YafY